MGSELGSLAGAALTGLTSRDRRLADGLHPLPANPRLRRLAIDNLAADRNLRGIERWPNLEQVAFCGIPDADEVRALARLPRLRRISLSSLTGPDSPASVSALRDSLPAVEIVTEH